jgi:hypothetical protein
VDEEQNNTENMQDEIEYNLVRQASNRVSSEKAKAKYFLQRLKQRNYNEQAPPGTESWINWTNTTRKGL